MSRYLVDKFLYRVDRDEAWLARYAADAASCVADWEASEAHTLGSETTSGHAFTAEERAALASRDHEALYRMGAHPFILWTLFIPLLERSYPTAKALQDAYAKQVAPYGRPDFRT
jgi:hypothetical protein